MQSFLVQMAQRYAAFGLSIYALSVLPGDLSFSQGALAAKAPSSQGAGIVPTYPPCPARGPCLPPLPLDADTPSCTYRIVAGDTLGRIAKHYGTTLEAIMRVNQEARVPGQQKVTDSNVIRAGAVLLIPTPLFPPGDPAPEATFVPQPTIPPDTPLPPPVSEDPAAQVNTQALALSTDENIVKALAEVKDVQKALQTAVQQQGKQIDGLIATQQRVALAVGGAFTLVILGVVLWKVCGSPLPAPVPPSVPNTYAVQPLAPAEGSQENGSIPEVTIATQYLSTPKHEDVICTDVAHHRYAIVLADGASSYRCNGTEISGGGREAATSAAHTAITYLRRHMRPAMGLHEMLAALHDCFSAVQTALERHNASTPIPGGTTLLIALLCQGGNGRWYWLYGNLGNGVLALLHSEQLLAGWPVQTPLLSKYANGVTTITMPGYTTKGYRPSVGVRPHSPGDILVMGSDGLEHLDTVTKKCDKLYFSNYLWQQIRNDRARLELALQGMPSGREDTPWMNALELDDTTIGILWA